MKFLFGEKRKRDIEKRFSRITKKLFSQGENKVYLITSLRHGAGKSTLSKVIGVNMALAGKKVAIVDFFSDSPDKTSIVNEKDITGKYHKGLNDFLSHGIGLKEICKKTETDNLLYIPSGNNHTLIPPFSEIKRFIDTSKTAFAITLLDSSIIDDTLFLSIIDIVDGVILIVECERDSISDVRRGVNRVKSSQGNLIGIILNKENNPLPQFIRDEFDI